MNSVAILKTSHNTQTIIQAALLAPDHELCRYTDDVTQHTDHHSSSIASTSVFGTGRGFLTEVYTLGCHWFPRLLASSEYACDQWHSSRVFTPLTGWHCTFRPNTEGEHDEWGELDSDVYLARRFVWNWVRVSLLPIRVCCVLLGPDVL
jgi:hypothetical protein